MFFRFFHNSIKKDGTVWAWGATSLGSIRGRRGLDKEFGNVPIQIKGINDVVNIYQPGVANLWH